MTTQAQLDVLLNSSALQVMSAMMGVITGMPQGTIPEVIVEVEPLGITLKMEGSMGAVVLYCQPRMGTLQ